MQPTYYTAGAGIVARLALPITGEALITSPTSVVGSISPLVRPAWYQGQLPARIGPSTVSLNLNLAGRGGFAPTWYSPLRSEPHFAQVSVRYQPRFTFMKAL